MLKGMEPAKKRMALGQGLDALLPLNEPAGSQSPDRNVVFLPIDSLIENPHQPRRSFDEEALAELSRSIQEMGVIQPLVVRPRVDGRYEIVAGERRWRAARMAGSSTIPAMVRNLSDSESLEIALIENIQREDLNPVDTAEAYDVLIKKFSYTHENLAQRLGKDRTSITNHLRLLRLPDPIKQYVREDQLSMGHARTLLTIEHAPTQMTLSQRVIRRRLSVRELERIVQNYRKKQERNSFARPSHDPDLASLEQRLSRHFSTKVILHRKQNNTGKVEIHFHSNEELVRLLEVMGYREDFS